MRKHTSKLFTINVVYTLLALVFSSLAIVSCGGNSAVTPASNNTKLLIVNTSPDAGPIQCYLNNVVLGNSTTVIAQRLYFRYSTVPAYNSVGTGVGLTIQLKAYPITNLITQTDTLNANTNYSIFLTGLAAVDSLSAVFTVDTATVPALGRGKVRFLNLSPRSSAMDVYINGTLGFSKVAYAQTGTNLKYIEIPAGTYDFKVNVAGAASSTLVELGNTVIQDGKLYTVFTKGMVGRVDSAAITLNVVANQ